MTESLDINERQSEKTAVGPEPAYATVAITSLKIVVGITIGSLGILSEAAHSGLDLVAAAVSYFSVRVSDKPADATHQYGVEPTTFRPHSKTGFAGKCRASSAF